MGLLTAGAGAAAARTPTTPFRLSSGPVRQSPLRQGRTFWLAGYVGKEELRRLVGLARATGCASPVRRSSGGDLGTAAVSGLLGEVAVDHESGRGRALCLDRARACGLASRGSLYVSLVRPGAPRGGAPASRRRRMSRRAAVPSFGSRVAARDCGYVAAVLAGFGLVVASSSRSSAGLRPLCAATLCPAASNVRWRLRSPFAGGLPLLVGLSGLSLSVRCLLLAGSLVIIDRLPLSRRSRGPASIRFWP